VTAGEFGPWAPIGAVATASGYEVAWKETGASEYQISNVDSNGNMGTSTAVVSGTSATVESAELVFNQDLNGDGTIGPPPNNGGNTVAMAQTPAVSIGGAGHDAFIFKPGLGADAMGSAASWHPTALDHVSVAPGINELQALLIEAQNEHALFQFANGGHDAANPSPDPNAGHVIAHQPHIG
jgi:serralysin